MKGWPAPAEMPWPTPPRRPRHQTCWIIAVTSSANWSSSPVSRRFSRQFDQALRAGSRGKAVDESEFINIIDHFILQRPLPGGRTVVETFVSAHPELAEADRQMLLGWRDVVEGVFEIRERDGKAIIAVNLIDELTYRVYSNAGPVALASIHPPGASRKPTRRHGASTPTSLPGHRRSACRATLPARRPSHWPMTKRKV